MLVTEEQLVQIHSDRKWKEEGEKEESPGMKLLRSCVCNGSPSLVPRHSHQSGLRAEGVRQRCTALQSPQGPRAASDEMTRLDILDSARLNPRQEGKSCGHSSLSVLCPHPTPFSLTLLCFFKLSFESSISLLYLRGLSGKWKLVSPLYFTALSDPLSFSLPLERIGRAALRQYVQQSQLWHEQYQW